MNFPVILLSMLAISFHSVAFGAEGGMGSGGGGPQTQYFIEGKTEAVRILREFVEYSPFSKMGKKGQKLEDQKMKEVRAHLQRRSPIAFLHFNAERMADDLEASPILWREKPHPNTSKCATTEFGKKKAPIWLSHSRCDGVTSVEAATRTLLHEVVHHFQRYEERDTVQELIGVLNGRRNNYSKMPSPSRMLEQIRKMDAQPVDTSLQRLENFADVVALIAWKKASTDFETADSNSTKLCPQAELASVQERSQDTRAFATTSQRVSSEEAAELRSEGKRVRWQNLSSGLIGEWDSKNGDDFSVMFIEDHSVLSSLPNIESCAYQAGYMYLQDSEGDLIQRPFVTIVDEAGNSAVVSFLEIDGLEINRDDEQVYSSSKLRKSYFIFVPGRSYRDDQLHLGGDTVSEGFTAMERVLD